MTLMLQIGHSVDAPYHVEGAQHTGDRMSAHSAAGAAEPEVMLRSKEHKMSVEQRKRSNAEEAERATSLRPDSG